MSFSLSRLTLYALISALEEDLRRIIVENVPISQDSTKVFGQELFDTSMKRLASENGRNSYVESYSDLIDYIDFPDAFKVIQRNKSFLGDGDREKFTKFIPSLEKLVPVRNRVSHSRPLHFEDLPLCLDIVDKIRKETGFDFKSLAEIEKKIASNPGWVLELNVPPAPKDQISHNLPVPDFDETGFMGRKEHLTSLRKMLKGPYPVISIIGEGGLGKSALALKIAYDLLDSEGIRI